MFNTQHGHTSFPDASECRVIYVGVCCSGIPAWCWCVLGVCPLLLVDGEQWAHVYACKYMHVYYICVLYVHMHSTWILPTRMHTHTKMHTHAHPTYIWEQLHSTGTSDDFRFSCPANFAAFFFLPLPRPTGGAKQGVADNFALRLLLLFDQLREVASSRRSDLPDDDPVSTLELIIFFLGSVQTQIQHMQVSLLES